MSDKSQAAPPASGQPERVPALTPEQREFLDKETDHFFNGEMAHEQRSAWLLTLASGLLIAAWRVLNSSALKMDDLAFYLLTATVVSLLCSVALSLWAIWPLGGGRNPGQLRPWASKGSNTRALANAADGSLPGIAPRFRRDIDTIVWEHYIAHRRRAEVKGRRVVRVTLFLFLSLLLGGAAIMATLFDFA
ncbi:MAG: hypothetical protein AAGC55_28425 [Myxococcota bacterium]